MSESVVREERDGLAVLLVPATMTPEVMAGLEARLGDPARRAFVLTGAGRQFCVGADLKWLGSLDDPGEGVATLVAAHHRVVRAMRAVPVPVVTAVNGAAAGGGMSLALAGDYCVAAPEATFTAAYFKLGLTPDGGNSSFLPALVGRSRTMEMLLTNRRLTGSEAAAWGLVNEVAGDPLERACEMGLTFDKVPAETLLTSRRLLDVGLEAQLQAEEQAVAQAARRPDFRQALDRFLKR